MKTRLFSFLAIALFTLLALPALSHAAVVTNSVFSNAPDSITMDGSSYNTANYVDVKIGTTSVRYYRPDGPYGYKNSGGSTMINWNDNEIVITGDISLAGKLVQSVTFYVSGPYNYTLHPPIYISPYVANAQKVSDNTFNVSGQGFQNASYIALVTSAGLRYYYNPLSAGTNPAGVTVNSWTNTNIQITDVRASLAGMVFNNLEFYGGSPTTLGASAPVDLFFPFDLASASSPAVDTLRVVGQQDMSNATSFVVTYDDNTTEEFANPAAGTTVKDIASTSLDGRTVTGVEARRNGEFIDALTGLNIHILSTPVNPPTSVSTAMAFVGTDANGNRGVYTASEALTDISPVFANCSSAADAVTFSPDHTKILIQDNGADGFHLWTANADGTGCSRLDAGFAFAYEASWIGNTNDVLFQGRDANNTLGIWRATPGQTPVAVPGFQSNDNHFIVSPDGTKIAFIRYDGSYHTTINILPITGGTATAITAGPNDYYPAWSPDSQYVFYGAGPGYNSNLKLYRVAVTGGTPLLITAGTQRSFASYSIAPNGTTIIFNNNGNTLEKVDISSGTPVETTIDSTGRASTPITFSADGTRAIYGCYNASYTQGICNVSLSGGAVTFATALANGVYAPNTGTGTASTYR